MLILKHLRSTTQFYKIWVFTVHGPLWLATACRDTKMMAMMMMVLMEVVMMMMALMLVVMMMMMMVLR